MKAQPNNAIITQGQVALFDSHFIRKLDEDWRKICEEHNGTLLAYEKARQASRHEEQSAARQEVEIRKAGMAELHKTYLAWASSEPGRFARRSAKDIWKASKEASHVRWFNAIRLHTEAVQRLRELERESIAAVVRADFRGSGYMDSDALKEGVDMARFCFTIGVVHGSRLWRAIVKAMEKVEARENSVDMSSQAA